MSDFQTIAIFVVFAGVILAIAFNLLDMLLATLLGVSIMVILGVFVQQDVLNAIQTASGPIALLFGGMVVARVLEPTGIFAYVGTRFLLLTGGSGKRFLLGIVALVTPICAFLPNATTVILVAPIIVRTAQALKVDFVGPLILTAILSNSAGMLTLVGDPATFLVGSAIKMTFTGYLQRISLGGLLAILVVIPLLPILLKETWHTRCVLPGDLRPTRIERPWFCLLSLAVLGCIVILFLFGESLPSHIVPPAVSIIGASLALLLIHSLHVEPLDAVLKDIDWKTIIFLGSLFFLVEAFTKTGFLQGLATDVYRLFGTNLLPVALILLGGVGLVSSVLANIPVVAAMLQMTKGYLVIAELVPEEALGATFSAWPEASLPLFVAMMFGATLGGNATLIGASANIVAAGICGTQGRPVRFAQFMRYGVPVTVCQLAVSALYVMALFLL